MSSSGESGLPPFASFLLIVCREKERIKKREGQKDTVMAWHERNFSKLVVFLNTIVSRWLRGCATRTFKRRSERRRNERPTGMPCSTRKKADPENRT